MECSASGLAVSLEGPALLINHDLQEQRARVRAGTEKLHRKSYEVIVPAGHVCGGVLPAVYNAYRRGLDSAGADCVITTMLPSGHAAVLLARRGQGKCHAGQWWIFGGATHAYRPILDFLAERIKAEIGVSAAIEGLIGVYRCAASDFAASVLVLCYVAFVEYSAIAACVRVDADHTARQLFTLDEYLQLPEAERHPYLEDALVWALGTML